jgi:hypothetical protein
VFTPVLAKHSKSFSLIDCISVGVDRMQRNFEPMRKQVEAWPRRELTDVTAKVVILTALPTPAATETHRPIPHHEIVEALVETLGFRHIGFIHDEYAVSPDGMKVFGVLDLATEMEGCRCDQCRELVEGLATSSLTSLRIEARTVQ